jgi:hypothetical protein
MYLNPETTAILVADRRSARETNARRRRTLVEALRACFRAPAATRLPVTTVRTTVETPARAA